MRVSVSLLRAAVERTVSMELGPVTQRLNDFAPLKYAGNWDNVGLLVEPASPLTVSKILLTNDLTEPVLDEAIATNCNLILSYHPPIFSALKRITRSHWKQRIVAKCLEKSIAIYSPHTSYDALDGGVNDWLVSAFGEASVVAVDRASDRPNFSFTVKFVNVQPDKLPILPDICAKLASTKGCLEIKDNSSSLCGVMVSEQNLTDCVTALREAGIEFIILKLESMPLPSTGMGRMATLSSNQTIASVVQKLKSMTGLNVVRLALAMNHKMDTVVKTGAVCAGSGTSVLKDVKAELLISGEMNHHDVMEFVQTGRSVVLLEHSNSERGFLSAVLRPRLQELFNNQISVTVSAADRDPLQFV